MKVLAVGDLHAYEFSWWPPVQSGLGEYLDRVRHLVAVTIPEVAARVPELGAVVFLGDVAEEVARTGKIAAKTLSVLSWSFTALRKRLPAVPVYLLEGNHDKAGDGTSWLSVLERAMGGVTVVRDYAEFADATALVAYGPAAAVAQRLERAAQAGRSVVFGHWYCRGARADNGYELSSEGAVPLPAQHPFRRLVLGDIHTPQGGADDLVVYLGSPLRYSWSSRDTGSRRLGIVDTATAAVEFVPVECPAFVGPTDDLSGLGKLPAGSFVRYIVERGNTTLLDAVRRQFPGLRFEGVLRDSLPAAAVTAPRLSLLDDKDLRPVNVVGDAERAGMVDRYVEHCGKAGTLPQNVAADRMRALGREFLGLTTGKAA